MKKRAFLLILSVWMLTLLASCGGRDQPADSSKPANETDALTETVEGVIDDIRSAVINGTTQYFILLEGGRDYFLVSASDVPLAVLLNAGDRVEISYYPAAGGVALPAFDVKLLETQTAPLTEPFIQDVPRGEDLASQSEGAEFLETEN